MSNKYQEMDRTGLVLFGVVSGRSKRFVGDKNIEVVTYRINDGSSTYFVDHWKPDSYYELGCEISLPVIVKPYVKNTNVYLNYAIRTDKCFGEEF